MTDRITVSTSFSDEMIITEFAMEDNYTHDLSPRTTLITQAMHLADEQVRQALIKLGWTPPPDVRTGLGKRG